jgi:predicted amidohydrolase
MGLAAAAASATAADADPPYLAIALQLACDAVNADATPEAARERIGRSIARVGAQVRASVGFLRGFSGVEPRLVVLPEYAFTGFPSGESRALWQAKAAFDPGGREYEQLAALAQATKVYLAVNAYATDKAFPDLYFQATTIFSPSGETVLYYRRMISLFAPTPFDVWARFLDVYGYDAVFPVARTEIGTLAAIASEEILYPEIARMTAMKGAEVFVHPTSEVGSPDLTPKEIARRARAVENMAYLVSANSAGITGTPIPAASTDGMSKVVDFGGKVMAAAGGGETLVANAVIDLAALRSARRRAGMSNLTSRQPWSAYAPAYGKAEGVKPGAAPLDRADATRRQSETIRRLIEAGVIR